MTPVVSVVIDTYNHERFIEEAIASALGQDFPRAEYEILVVDDGSTDRTAEIVRKFEPQVRLLQKANGGQASSINLGTAQAKGTYVAFLDGDDVWLPNKLSRVVREFEKEPRVVMVYHKYCFWDSRDGSTWEPEYFAAVSGDILGDRRKLLTYVAAPTSSLAFRREALLRLMPVPEECSFMHDIYLVATVVCLGSVAGIPECLTRNRVHGQNLCFADRGEPNPEVLRTRVKTWDAAIAAAERWIHANASGAARSRVRVLLSRWRLIQDMDEFRLKQPGRFRSFAHQARYNATYGPLMTRAHLAYLWSYALAVLAAGAKNARYMEGIRTRAKRSMRYFERRFRAATHSSRPV